MISFMTRSGINVVYSQAETESSEPMEAYQEETIDAGQNNEHKISRLPTGKADTCRKPLGYLIGSPAGKPTRKEL